MKWISVKDQLPQQYCALWICGLKKDKDPDDTDNYWMVTARFKPATYYRKAEFIEDGCCGDPIKLEDVTHWMPFEYPPEPTIDK